MLNEPIMGLLPATEEDILSVNARVSRDHVLGRLRRLERCGAVKKRKNGKYYVVKRPKDEPNRPANGSRPDPVNQSQLKERTCSICKKKYRGIQQHFGYKNGKVCKHCREAGYNPVESLKGSKVCVVCGEEKYGLKLNFRQTSVAGTGGRVKVWRDICKTCEGRRIGTILGV